MALGTLSRSRPTWRIRTDMSAQENIIWEGSPSQVTNLGLYLLCAVLFFLVVPIFYAIWKWLVVRNKIGRAHV